LAECWWLWFGFAAARAFVAGCLAVSADAKRRGRLVDESEGWLYEFLYTLINAKALWTELAAERSFVIAEHQYDSGITLLVNLFTKVGELTQHPRGAAGPGVKEVTCNDQPVGVVRSDEPRQPLEILLARALRHRQSRPAKGGCLAQMHIGADQCPRRRQQRRPAREEDDVSVI
jgi:hypothetical protein